MQQPLTACFGVVILAAGKSSRMGRPKLLLPWGGTTVIGHLLRQWQVLQPGQTTVVCASTDEALRAELVRLAFPSAGIIINDHPAAGMFSSLQCAARWPNWPEPISHVVISLGDQPHLRLETMRALMEASAAHPWHICVPVSSGLAGHPVVLPRKLFFALRDTAHSTLHQFISASPGPLWNCEVNDPGLHLDLDTPADFERIQALDQSCDCAS